VDKWVNDGRGREVGNAGKASRVCNSSRGTDPGAFDMRESGAVRRRVSGIRWGCFFFGS